MTTLPVVSGPMDPVQLGRHLPAALQYALERRYYDSFDVTQVTVQDTKWYDLQVHTRFFPLLEIAHGKDIERSLHHLNMQNALASVRDGSHNVVFLVTSDGPRARLYFGLCRLAFDSSSTPTDEYARMLQSALRSNFCGIKCGDFLQYQQFHQDVLGPIAEHQLIGAVVGIPSLKREADAFFVQGLDRLIDGLRGERYAFLVIAEPIDESEVDQIINTLWTLSSEIHAQVRRSVTASRGQTTTETAQRSGGYSTGLGTGAAAGAVLGMLLGLSASYTRSQSRARATSGSENLAEAREFLDKSAQYAEQMIDHYVDRLQAGKSLGFWNAGVFLLTSNRNTFLRGQSIIRGLFSGSQSYFEPLRLLNLSPDSGKVQHALIHFRNPTLLSTPNGPHPMGDVFHKLATPMTTEELSVVINLPRREVPGVKLRPVADFGLNPPVVVDGIELGHVIYRGEVLTEPVVVEPDRLTQHTFITGITGAGKTNTCLVLLQKAYRRGVPFLVIEPAKTEYRVLMADKELCRDLQVFTLGDEKTSPFRLNPFEFVRGFNLLTHIDFLKAVFNASFPMYASMPYILEEAILDVYKDRGWDVVSSMNRFVDVECEDYTPYLPTLGDLFSQIDAVVRRKRYAAQLTMDISAALKARLQSLLNGGKGLMLNTQRSFPIEQLLSRPTVLEMRYVGDDDEKAFLMALLLVLIYEHCQVSRLHSSIQHLTLIEEAHRLLKNIPPSVSLEVGNARGKAVEMFTDILAEVREYGEGFIIVDQIPSKLTPDVVKNTGFKILHRLVADDDRRFVGNAMGLSDEQREHVVRLRPGEAVLHSVDLDKPILAQIVEAKDGLKSTFQASIGVEGLREQMRQVRKANIEAFRRWPGCLVCDAPCEYLSSWNQPDGTAVATFARLFNALLYSEPQDYLAVWEGVAETLRGRLAECYKHTDWTEGAFVCHLVQLSMSTVAAWCEYYCHGLSRLQARVEAERQVARVLQALLREIPRDSMAVEVEGLRRSIWDKIAVEPNQERQGCARCRQRCRFGYLVQGQAPLRARVLAQRVRQTFSDPSHKSDYGLLVQLLSKLASAAVGISMAPEDLADLGFCYLCNGANKERIQRGYQRARRFQ